MITTKIQSDNFNIYIDCPHCEMWEKLGVDDPRKRLNALPIIKWEKNELEENEITINECCDCKNKFKVEWDYSNPII